MNIEFIEITKTFKTKFTKKHALQNFTLHIEQGEVFGFLGPNGAGKSTAIKILLDFIRPDKGKITIKGKPADQPSVRRYMGYLPENPCFYDHLSAMELLLFVGRTAGMTKKGIHGRAETLFEKLSLLHAKNQLIRTYSKGMTQRIGLAMAMIHNPEIYILDEPMSGLDPIGRKLVANLILDMKHEGKTVFFSSHILSDIERLCDRVGILHQGKLLFCGDVKKFKGDSNSLEDAFVELIESHEHKV